MAAHALRLFGLSGLNVSMRPSEPYLAFEPRDPFASLAPPEEILPRIVDSERGVLSVAAVEIAQNLARRHKRSLVEQPRIDLLLPGRDVVQRARPMAGWVWQRSSGRRI